MDGELNVNPIEPTPEPQLGSITIQQRAMDQRSEIYEKLRSELSEQEWAMLVNVSTGIRSTEPGWLHVATAGPTVVGLAVTQPIGPDQVELKVRFVRRAYRERGIGRALGEAAFAAAQAAGYHHFSSQVTSPGARKTMQALTDQHPGQVTFTDHGDWYAHTFPEG